MRNKIWMVAWLAFFSGCVDGNEPSLPSKMTPVKTDRTYLRDQYGRYVFVNGINVSCTTKKGPTDIVNGIPTYVGRPFPLEEAAAHFAMIRDFGFNAVRLLVIWEGIEPEGPGKYDMEYLNYIRGLVQAAAEARVYVLLDMHQDMFSRHMFVKYNENPPAEFAEPNSLERTLLSLVKPYSDVVQGDGAPRWVIEACLQEKDMSSPFWGVPRVLSDLQTPEVEKLWEVYKRIAGIKDDGAPTEGWVGQFLLGLPGKFSVHETIDMLPFSNWTLSTALSVDMARLYACLFAGDKVFPGLTVSGKNVKDFLQESYAAAWAEVARQVSDLPNVLGYDLINEPGGNFVVLAAIAGIIKSGVTKGARDVLVQLFGEETGDMAYESLLSLRLFPPDTEPETLRLWGLDKIDVFAALNLNYGFDEQYLRPFYERVGRAIVQKDPDGVIFIEGTRNISTEFLGSMGGSFGGMWENPMTRPAGLREVVFAPHWYPDIYPFPGFNQPPREFSPEELQFRDYKPGLRKEMTVADYSLGNIPVVFGEFGSYFNYGGIQKAQDSGYAVTKTILDNYYEAFDQMFLSRMLWCYSPENDREYGDGWNKEDFSVLDWKQRPRGQLAWARPFARALAGKPISTHFYSDYHYFDPDKGEVVPKREFEVRYESKETDSPSEILVPSTQYPDGFYVWVSDGFCHYDPANSTLYHYPSKDEPGAEHWVRLLPPLPGRENVGWKYFFKGTQMVNGSGR